MADKFGWQKAARKNASVRGRRQQYHQKPRTAQSPVQFRTRCPQCGSFRVRKQITTFICQSCGHDSYHMETVKVRIDGKKFTPCP